VPVWIWGGAGVVLSFLLVGILFALIFKVLPDVRIDWRHIWIGAFATAFLFEGGKFALAFYLGRQSTSSSFGAAGAVVLLLLWVYYASGILFFGAEFTKAYALADGVPVTPTSMAEEIAPLGPPASLERARSQEPGVRLPRVLGNSGGLAARDSGR